MTNIPAPAPAKLTAEEIASDDRAQPSHRFHHAWVNDARNCIRDQKRAHAALVEERDRLAKNQEFLGHKCADLALELGRVKQAAEAGRDALLDVLDNIGRQNDGHDMEITRLLRESAAPPAADAKDTGR